MQISKKIILNTNNDKPNSRIIIKQGSIKTITLIVTLNDKGGVLSLPTGTTAKVRMLKPDKKQVLNDCTVSGNNVHVEITQQMQAVAGDGQCEVILFNGAKTFTTVSFPITIEPNVHDDSQIESTPEYDTLINSIIRIEGAIEVAREVEVLKDTIETKLANGEFNGPKGNKGDQGVKGDQGIQGIQGEQGIKGEKGDDGIAPFINSIYVFKIIDGNLVIVYPDETLQPPPFEIVDGNLTYTIGE